MKKWEAALAEMVKDPHFLEGADEMATQIGIRR